MQCIYKQEQLNNHVFHGSISIVREMMINSPGGTEAWELWLSAEIMMLEELCH